MRRLRIILGVVVATAAVLYVLMFCVVDVWIGSYDLTVHVEGCEAPVRSVSCQAFSNRGHAEEMTQFQLQPSAKNWPTTVDPFHGEPIKVPVTTTGRDSSAFGLELSRTQYRSLAVIATYADGRKVGQIVEIPDGRVSRDVHVAFD